MQTRFNFRNYALPLAIILAGLMLLTRPSHAAAFTPTRFSVVDAGTAGKPDVILIPGLNSSRSVWDAEAKLLAPRYRLHLLQVNGFAGQPAGSNAGDGPLLAPIVDELHAFIVAGKMHPAVVGHSLGGMLALMLADKYPADAQKLVIVDSFPTAALMLGPGMTPAKIAAQVPMIRQQYSALPEDQYKAMQPLMAARLVKNADAQKTVAAWSMASDRTVGVNALIEDMTTDVTPDLRKMTVPTLMLYPLETPTQKADEVDALYHDAYKTMPNATLKRIDDSRHFIMYDQPAAFDAAVQAFLK